MKEEFIQGLEDYKQETDLYPHTSQTPKSPKRIAQKAKKKNSAINQKTKE